jgi:transposase
VGWLLLAWEYLIMAYGYRPVIRDQPFLLPPDLREWLPAGHLAWFVIDAVESLDLSRLQVRSAAGPAGRAAYDPRMLLALLVYGYARGLRSSRKIERACCEDVAFRVICAQDPPDHATIARFRRHWFADGEAMAGVFAQVLEIAARAGLGRLGLVAVDGTKIAASASKDANRTEAKLRELAARMLAEAEEADAGEDALFGSARGDELPAELADPVTRRERIAAAAAQLEAERAAAESARQRQAAEYLGKAQASGRPPGNCPAGAGVAAAELELARKTAAQQAKIEDWDRRKAGPGPAPRGPRPVPPERYVRVREAAAKLQNAKARAARAARRAAAKDAARKGPGPVANITDPHSHLMPVRGGGFVQGYNAQAARSADGLILAGLVTTQTTDYASFGPLLDQIQQASDLLRAHARGPLHRKRARNGTVLADAGYLSEDNLTRPGPGRLIATGRRRGGRRLGPHGTAMAARLADPLAAATYRQRAPIIETAFGHRKHNLGFRRFSMRGLPRVTGEWTFAAAVDNLTKIHATGWQPA